MELKQKTCSFDITPTCTSNSFGSYVKLEQTEMKNNNIEFEKCQNCKLKFTFRLHCLRKLNCCNLIPAQHPQLYLSK